MCKFSQEEAKNIINNAIDYYEKNYPDGATIEQIEADEQETALEYYRYYELNIKYSRNKYNPRLKKIRDKWYALESLEKIYIITRNSGVIDFSKMDKNKLANKFIANVPTNSYKSYRQEDELIR